MEGILWSLNHDTPSSPDIADSLTEPYICKPPAEQEISVIQKLNANKIKEWNNTIWLQQSNSVLIPQERRQDLLWKLPRIQSIRRLKENFYFPSTQHTYSSTR